MNKEKESKLWADVNEYIISLTLHISRKMFVCAKDDLRHIKEDIKKLEKKQSGAAIRINR